MGLLDGALVSGSKIPTSPRSVCAWPKRETSSKQCCNSWSDNLWDAEWFHLRGAAEAILEACGGSDGLVSGKSYDTLIGRTCTTQCLSNRPDGCNDS